MVSLTVRLMKRKLRNNLYFITIRMSVDFKKYNEKMKSIERGIEQIMNDAIKENKEALEMKKESEGTITELKKELERYKNARKVTEDMLERQTKEMNNMNKQVSEVENKIYLDTQEEIAKIQEKIEEAKMNSNYAIETNKRIDTLKGLLKDQAMMKGQVY
jgi:predicted nuclease with TOPRIM domain